MSDRPLNYSKHPSTENQCSSAVSAFIIDKKAFPIAPMFFLTHLIAISFFAISHNLISWIEI
jgi:hypothetical protein